MLLIKKLMTPRVRCSVITPSIRPEALAIVRDALDSQTFTDFEWLIGSPFDPQIPEAIWVQDNFEGGFWTLNRIMTKMCKQAKGEIIVFLQDNIWVNPDALERFITSWENKGGAITGVGDQYSHIGEYGKPFNKVWNDPRKTDKFGSFYEVNPDDWEINFACIGKNELEKVGYFVDEADFLGYGGDNVLLAEKLDKIGVKFFIDQTNESFSIKHGRERADWDENYILWNGGKEKLTMTQ
jgi:hypothetical protein